MMVYEHSPRPKDQYQSPIRSQKNYNVEQRRRFESSFKNSPPDSALKVDIRPPKLSNKQQSMTTEQGFAMTCTNTNKELMNTSQFMHSG